MTQAVNVVPKASTKRPSGHCHVLIKETAEEMALAVYETVMKDNAWYKVWRRRNIGATPAQLATRFVAKTWPTLVDEARATLASMLQKPIDPEVKASIYEALSLDATLLRDARSQAAAARAVRESKGTKAHG